MNSHIKFKMNYTKHICIIISLLVFQHNLFSKMLFPYYKNGLWGLCDSNKKIIVEPKYNKVEWIDGNYYKVYKQDSLNIKNKKVGLVNEVGKMIVHDTFNYILFFHNQQNIPTLIQASFDSINSSYFSINGNYLFTSSNSFYNNYEYASLCEPFIIFTVRYRYDNFVYYHIPSGQIVKKQLRYLEQIPFIKGSLILTLMDMKKIQIDSNNKPVANPYYKDVIHHGNNVYSAIVNKKRVWLNENGKRIANKDFLWIDKFVGKYAVVRKGDKLGVVDNKYNLIIPYKYYDIKIISNNRFFVKYSKWGMLNTKNQQKIALKYENLEETNIYLGSKNNNLILGTNSEHRNGYTQNIEDLFLANGQHLSHSKNGGILRRYININETSLWNEDYGVGEIVKYWPSYKNDSCVLVDKNLNPKSKKYKSYSAYISKKITDIIFDHLLASYQAYWAIKHTIKIIIDHLKTLNGRQPGYSLIYCRGRDIGDRVTDTNING